MLPFEKVRGEEVWGKRDMIVVGTPSENAMLKKCLEDGERGGGIGATKEVRLDRVEISRCD